MKTETTPLQGELSFRQDREYAVGEVRLLHEYFERQVDLLPERPAVIFNGEVLSFLEVEKRANRLARRLKALGIGPGQLVALLLDRSARPIVSLLAVLKAGAGYVPVDPVYPDERISWIFENSDIHTVITEASLKTRIHDDFDGNVIVLDEQEGLLAGHSCDRIPPEVSGVGPEDICYVIYTSGTTGRPKGVVTEHRNATSFLASFRDVCTLTGEDRVYQGFSLGFDGSVEEIWMAFSCGAALVVADGETCRLASEAARLINRERVTYFSTVPTFLSMIKEDLPTVRWLIVSGEVCSPELVSRWATPERHMLNAYGPTEATVNTTIEHCSPGLPVTIGKPIRDYEAYILDRNLQPVEYGHKGELFIGGPAIARGYLNQPELTARHFIVTSDDHHLPRKRLYRTGDRAKFDRAGNLLFLGRTDSQVKIRGFRIEIAEVETVLREHPMVEGAAVKVIESEGIRELAAFVTLVDPRATLDRDSVLMLAQSRLPHYMVPACLDVIDRIPTLTSGKVARKLLPASAAPLVKASRTIVEPTTALEQKVVAVFEKVFKVHPVSVEDNFFLDLAGYSLLAARAVTLLREELALEVAIRDIYDHPTARRLSRHLEKSRRASRASAAVMQPAPQAGEPCAVSGWTRAACHTLQALSLALFYGIGAGIFSVYVILGFSWFEGKLAPEEALSVAIAVGLALYPALLLFVILSKWILIGRFKAGRYPLWGFFYFRWWFVTRAQAFSGIGTFAGTPLLNLYLRLMGARIGKNVLLDSAFCSTFDLISIGEDSSIGSETHYFGCRVEDGTLILGRVDIGRGCFVGIHSNLGLNVRMEDGSALGDLSMLPDGGVIARNRTMKGSPARASAMKRPHAVAYKRHPVRYSLMHLLALFLAGLYLAVMALPTAALVLLAFIEGGMAPGIASLYLAIPLEVVTFCLSVALLKRLLLGKVRPGLYPVESGFYLRKWLIDWLMRVSTRALRPLYTTIYLPPWLRMLGARIGRRAEISTVSQISPELVSIADESFFADGSIIGGRHFYRGHVEIGLTHIGRRSFVGNSAILPIGSDMGDHCLLGCLSCPPERYPVTPDKTEWLGSPAFRLPYRKKVEGFGEDVTFSPTRKLYTQRLAIDALRIVLPGVIGVSGLLGLTAVAYASWRHLGVMPTLLLAPLFGTALATFSALAVALIKKAVMGTFRPVVRPLWSVYVWLNEMINGAYESVFAPATVPMLGTPFFAPFLRAMGCRVGKNTFIDTTLFSEFDLVRIGDGAALNRGAVVQNHLFEDRIMKSDYLKIGDRCSVGNMAVVLYSTEMGEGSSIGPLSLLMKGETLPERSRWQGIPIQAV